MFHVAATITTPDTDRADRTAPNFAPQCGTASIDEAEVRTCLVLIRRGRLLLGSPLVDAACVDQRLRERGVPRGDVAARERELKALFATTVTERLARARQAGPSGHQPISIPAISRSAGYSRHTGNPGLLLPSEVDWLRRDFGVDAVTASSTPHGGCWHDRNREAWSCLYYHYIYRGDGPPLDQIAIAAYVCPGEPHFRKHIQRRLSLGVRLLTDELRDLDHAAHLRQALPRREQV